MRVLGVETSCDESAAAIVEDGHRILANTVATQIDVHRRYGGVVPEVASRQHLQTIIPVIETALHNSGLSWDEIDGVAVTNGPGLAGSLLVGVNAAKSVAFARRKPLVGCNHLESHIYANWLDTDTPTEPPEFPALCLVVSGGHTDLILMHDHGVYERLGRTVDDAAGEAFDKVARLLDLGFPGGPAIEKTAQQIEQPKFELPRAWMPGTWNFSFSGLKTAVLHVTREPDHPPVPEIAAGFQESVIDVLTAKTVRAAAEYGVRQILVAGGVAANGALRRRLQALAPVPVRVPPPKYCTDNAAMVAACGYFHFRRGDQIDFALDANPGLAFAGA
ncbi:MAG TPA: tRNA (adenosine(37)-N6)-threonylcarbamoyltransferase complex transferase subunit TsaD [Dehalococcoidia bacterium]|nr:tRNA (adenosine(37)-N6)-threonylcarbamoyltransferase complex transferase subunit TsaD [Dehalococcoidia bacterium]